MTRHGLLFNIIVQKLTNIHKNVIKKCHSVLYSYCTYVNVSLNIRDFLGLMLRSRGEISSMEINK